MKRKVFAWMLLAVMCISLFAGCGNKSKEDDKEKDDNDVIAVTPTAEPTSGTDVKPTIEPTAEPTPGTDVKPTIKPTAEPTAEPIKKTDFTQTNCEIALADRELYHYDMNLTLNPIDYTVSGHVKFDFYNDSEDAWDKLCFRDYPSMFTMPEKVGQEQGTLLGGELTKITNIVDGRDNKELTYKRDEDVSVIWITPETPLMPNEKMTLEYDFVAKIPVLADRFGAAAGVFNVTNFYPILAEYADGEWSHSAFINVGECFYSEVSNYNVAITVPKDFKVLSTGTESEKKDNGDTVTYVMDAPCVRDFVFSASSSYEVETRAIGDITVNVMYWKTEASNLTLDLPNSIEPVEMGSWVQVAFEAAEDSLNAFGYAFGKYPYSELDIIVCPLEAGGMEYPNLIQISDDYCRMRFIIDDNEKPRGAYDEFRNCVAHEIGHQWFMGIVGSNSGMQPWLDESFASYTELVFSDYLKEKKHEEGYKPMSLMTKPTGDLTDSATVEMPEKEGTLPINRSYYDYGDDNRYVTAVYDYGQRVLRQMEEILGREEFYSVIREYVGTHAFTNVKPEDFFEVLYKHAGTDNEKLNALIANCFEQ